MNDGILSEPIDLDGPKHSKPTYPSVPATTGLVVEYRATSLTGAIISYKPQRVVLRDRHGKDHAITPREGAFSIDGKPISLRAPAPRSEEVSFSSSGSVQLGSSPARIARASRIWVEGIHDAELVEKIWGEDLRLEGVVVEQMDGMDDLVERVSRFGPRDGRRVAILLDHLVEGSRESRAAAEIDNPHVLITGHPYVDVWQAIKPSVVGIDRWPEIPMGIDWKTGVKEYFDFDGPTGLLWKRMLARVESYRDVEQPLLNSVERMIDFVTQN